MTLATRAARRVLGRLGLAALAATLMIAAGRAPAGGVADAGRPDAGAGDAGRPDAAARDAGRPDGAVLDGGEEGPERISVRVGKTVALRLGFICIESICDDREVVRVEDGGDHLKLRGLKPGTTLCGFWKERSPRPRRLFEVTVVAEQPPPKR